MSFIAFALHLIEAAIRSPYAHSVGRYAIRQATAAVVREIRRQTQRTSSWSRIS